MRKKENGPFLWMKRAQFDLFSLHKFENKCKA